MATKGLWSLSVGEVGASRVRIYERRAGGPIQIEWSLDKQRHQRSLRYHTGLRVYDRRDATRIAETMSRKLATGHRERIVEAMTGTPQSRGVGELLEKLHSARESTWKETYLRDQVRFRKFWLDELGVDTALTKVTAAVVEDIVARNLSKRAAATRNRYKRYIVDAFTFGQLKLKWITEHYNLSAVDFEDPKSKGVSYTRAEMQALLPALEQVDPVLGWIGHVLWQTGRRLTSIRTLTKDAVTVEDDRCIIDMPEETDKAGQQGQVVIVGKAHELTKMLMQRPGKFVAGKAPPTLDLIEKRWWPDAEARAGITAVKGRKAHGVKRRFATETKGMVGRDKQSGTLETTLRGHYEVDDDVGAKLEVAEELARRVEAL